MPSARCSFAWPSDLCCLSDDQRARLALLRKRYEAGC
jgi:hypothetical protein